MDPPIFGDPTLPTHPSVHSVSARPSPSAALTTFPNPFEDEQEPGLLPTLLSKVKSTFASSASIQTASSNASKLDKGPAAVTTQTASEVSRIAVEGQTQTEAQAIAEAARNRAHVRRHSIGLGLGSGPIPISTTQSTINLPDEAASSRPAPTAPSGISGSRSLKPPSAIHSTSSSTSGPPSIAPSSAPSRRLVPPAERQWRPTGAAPAQVTISPVTSVTTTVQATSTGPVITEDGFTPPAHPRAALRAHFGQQTAQSHRPPISLHPQNPAVRLRRSSIATIPDSPSSVSLSAMIAANAELSQNASYVPGFPLAQDDTRSVRSFGFVKKSNSVSRLIRRMRGEGLSKHYWMADEHCKECYDCKSIFTAWRRKHHCRICGQIFCSRCASNIIGARRFGQEGAVRVCNLCLKIMEEYKDDHIDDDDRRSINSVSTSVRMPSISDRAFLDAAISPEISYAKSPFAASQLFSSNPNESLTAIDESAVTTRWREDEDLVRPFTPNTGSDDEDDAAIYATRPNTAAPFRRPMDDDAKSGEMQDQQADRSEPSSPATPVPPSPDGPPSRAETADAQPRRKVEFPRTDTISTDGGLELRIPLSRVDSNTPLIGLRTRLSSRASQGGLTALLDSEKTEGLWRARSHSFAQRPEVLSGASLQHFHLMLEQAIERAGLSHANEWHRTLSQLLLKVSTNLHSNVRAGDSIDVRAYVKIKKVPGGKISDSEYVDGIVITKNVAHKAMPRRLVNPRIMVVTFPLDYHRVETQFMSLDPILAQEKDYLRLLTRRIVDVRPHIVLVERSVSRIALEYLLEANIAVARSVKLSAIHQVARCTQADVVASMDKLATEPRLGRCAEFQIQSFEHELIAGRRKTLMRFEGCHRDYGCTIILRGADLATLRKVKVITDFMALVACHLKNEIILYNDEHNVFPPHPPMPHQYQDLLDTLLQKELDTREAALASRVHEESSEGDEDSPKTPMPAILVDDEDDERRAQQVEALNRTKEIARSLKPYLTTALSASAAIRFPPPAPLGKMADLDLLLSTLRRNRDEEEAAQILQEETKGSEPPKSAILEAVPPIAIPSIIEPPTEPSLVEVFSSNAMSALPTASVISKDGTRDPYRVLRSPEEIARESALVQVEHEHSEQFKLWQWYTRRHIPQLRPEDFQGIVYLYSLGCEGQEKPCVEPTLQAINFYQPDDLTVGQFLEGLTADAAKRCVNKTCERLLLFHFRLLVHGDRRLQIAMDQFPCPSPGHEDRIITWSYCRQCATPSPTTIIREETWKMSWGAYLEHCFYPPECSAGFSCPHDAYRDQIRYFAHRNLAIRIHNERIDLYEPVRPSISLQTKGETKVILKNKEYESALSKNAAFFDSILFRLRSFDYEIVQPEKVSLLKTALENMLARAVADREEMVNLLNRTYKLTPMTDVLALNTVLRTLQDKVVQWDSDFVDVEKTFMPSEKDLRRMTATHLKRLFANQDVFNSLDRNVAGLSVSEVDEKELKVSEGETETATEPPPSALEAAACETNPAELQTVETSDGGATPLAGVHTPTKDPLSGPHTPLREYDSDSTISAIKKSPALIPSLLNAGDAIESSGVESDNKGFVSRLPKRTKPVPSVADMVKRFQQESTSGPYEPIQEVLPERPRSAASFRRSSQRHVGKEETDSDIAAKAGPSRPRIRRGRTEQGPSRHRDTYVKPGLLSDGDRSYAANASRIPSAHGRRSFGGLLEQHRPASRSRPPTAPSTPPRSGRASPVDRQLGPSRITVSEKPRVSGKGRMPRQLEGGASGGHSPGLMRTAPRRTLPSSRVTSIARHFDRMSREADRERAKRITAAKGRRARPVEVTKAKVQVFNNVRDAFRDESDSASSEADNEEDDLNSDDSGESTADRPARTRRKSSSPVKPSMALTPLPASQSLQVPVQPSTSMETFASSSSSAAGGIPISVSASSVNAPSILSDTRSEMSFTDRLQIELPSFETSAPLPSVPVTPQLSTDTADEANKGELSHMSQMSESELSSGGERSSILKTLTGLWALRAGDYTPLEYPLTAAEHLFTDSRVIIRENEPTSIIAFTLSSKTYSDKMNNNKFQTNGRKAETFMPDESVTSDRASTWDIVSLDEAMDTDDPIKREGGTHLKYEFESGASTIFCRIFFAERFSALREACECEDSFVESLARCVQFDAAGGKSGSAFLKTKDDRFIAKEISRLEMDALTKFAPAYFEYTRNAIQGQRPTVLAKIYGFFKIGYRNAITGRVMKMNVLVMENLFYERRFQKIYDLKGSTRNRLIQPTGRVNEVLLDENLMELVYKHPLYLREHSKRILRSALFNDTLFLSNLNVMDYSLVVGVDADKRELVVGIVDYIRTFTWDKKLESWVKDSTFLGGAGKGEPTIVTPKQYKTRFRTAMEKFYFLSVPDRWSKLGADEGQVEDEAAATGT